MRPRIVETLAGWLGLRWASWIVPDVPLIYALAMAATLVVFIRRLQRDKISRYHALGAAIWAIFGALVGARIFDMVQNMDVTLADPWQAFSFSGGLASWGAYLGGSVGLFAYCLRNRQALMVYADAAGSCVGLAVAILRWACFLNGDDFGTLSNLPWAVRFPHASYPFVAQVQAGWLNPMADLSLPVHPVQLYLSVVGLVLFAIASWLWTRLRAWSGATFCAYWLMYCPLRFLMEFGRGDETHSVMNALTVPQAMAALTFAAAGIGLWHSLRLRRGSLPLGARA